jgi:8-oxo-dGTP pyrophosphatase MutT (NUDIX family)
MRKIVIAKALLFNEQGELLLVRRSKTAPRRALEWDFPGGYVDDDDESYQAACLREVQEEAGLSVVDNHLGLVYTESALGDFGGQYSDVSWLYFKGTATSTDVKLSYEHDDFTWVPLGRAKELIAYDRQLRVLDYLIAAQK